MRHLLTRHPARANPIMSRPVADHAGSISHEDPNLGLALEDVSGSYGRQRVVWNVSLRLSRGDGVAIIGRNGVGKTTLLRCITNSFGVRVSGQILLNGVNVAGLRPEQINRLGISIVPSDRRIFPLSVRENLVLGAVGPRPAERLEIILSYFQLLSKKLHQRGDTLSGGEQQALALARALMGNPEFLLLDEPTEGLAPSVVQQLSDVLEEVRPASDVGLIIVDRNVAFVSRHCSTVIGMSKGKLTSSHPIGEFVASESLREQLLTPAGSATGEEI